MEIQPQIINTLPPMQKSIKNNNKENSKSNFIGDNSINSNNYGKYYTQPYFKGNENNNIIDSSCNEKLELYKDNIPEFITNIKALKKKKGKDFINEAYPLVKKMMNLEDVAPENIIWKKNEGRPIVADYNYFDNSLIVYSDYILNMNKVDQIAFIAHELTHCKQTTNILRTEGLGPEKYAFATAISDLNANVTKDPKVRAAVEKLKKEGKLNEQIMAMVQKNYQEIVQAHKHTLELPKIPKDSKEGQQAYKDVIAQMKSNGADMNVYLKDPLELEARGTEKMIKTVFKNTNLK